MTIRVRFIAKQQYDLSMVANYSKSPAKPHAAPTSKMHVYFHLTLFPQSHKLYTIKSIKQKLAKERGSKKCEVLFLAFSDWPFRDATVEHTRKQHAKQLY